MATAGAGTAAIITNLFLIILIIFTLLFQIGSGAIHGRASLSSLYDGFKDDVEVLNATSFDSVYKCDRAVFVEFYAHWCGACQRYAPHWKELAKETKAWHSKVIRVAAIDCGDEANEILCRDFNIDFYPTLKLLPAQLVKSVQQITSFRSDKLDALVTKMILFIENHQYKPASWPLLEPFTSKQIDALFSKPYQNCEFGFLIFEKSSLDELGRKLILDFSEHSDRIVIRRIVSNPYLAKKFGIDLKDTSHLPVIYLVNNTKNSSLKAFEKFDLKLVERYARNLKQSFEIDNEAVRTTDERKKYSIMIKKFIQIIQPINSNANTNLIAESSNTTQSDENQQSYVSNMDDRVFMQDLESGLHLMLRSDVARSKLITGEKMKALKDWLYVLAKYFPGRMPVRNYLGKIYSQLNQSIALSGLRWKQLMDTVERDSFLPTTVDWRHCSGSQIKYRGYPCSLWTLFHVLTVSQIEMENNKQVPFEEDSFSVKEVIEAIRSFVLNFFTCRECADNFRTETQDYIHHLSKPYDAVLYMWTVHNSVNKRLERDESTDPYHPKTIFPTKSECPECYSNTTKTEPVWVEKEVIAFLTSFYSRSKLEGIKELDTLTNKIEKKFDTIVSPINFQKKRDLGIELDDSNSDIIQKEIKIDFRSKIFIVFTIAYIVVMLRLFYVYFSFARISKLKKHII